MDARHIEMIEKWHAFDGFLVFFIDKTSGWIWWRGRLRSGILKWVHILFRIDAFEREGINEEKSSTYFGEIVLLNISARKHSHLFNISSWTHFQVKFINFHVELFNFSSWTHFQAEFIEFFEPFAFRSIILRIHRVRKPFCLTNLLWMKDFLLRTWSMSSKTLEIHESLHYITLAKE